MKNVYVRMEITIGDYVNTIHHVFQTRCRNINYAAEWLVAHWYSNGRYNKDTGYWSFYSDEVLMEVLNVKELNAGDYNILNRILVY